MTFIFLKPGATNLTRSSRVMEQFLIKYPRMGPNVIKLLYVTLWKIGNFKEPV